MVEKSHSLAPILDFNTKKIHPKFKISGSDHIINFQTPKAMAKKFFKNISSDIFDKIIRESIAC